MFKDRKEAAKLLAEKLKQYKNSDGIILAVPRGGVVLGYEIAKELNLPLDVIMIKKIGHPYHKEFSIGSVSLQGAILNSSINVPNEYLTEEIEKARNLLKKQHKLYMGDREPINLKDKVVIIIDDGIATGGTILNAVEILKESKPKKIIIAVPVASPQAVEMLKKVADEVISLISPENFIAVGQFYENFEQTSDDEVIHLLRKANNIKEKTLKS